MLCHPRIVLMKLPSADQSIRSYMAQASLYRILTNVCARMAPQLPGLSTFTYRPNTSGPEHAASARSAYFDICNMRNVLMYIKRFLRGLTFDIASSPSRVQKSARGRY